MKAYISDTEDLRQDPSYQETWDDMIVNVGISLYINLLLSFHLLVSSLITWLNIF